MNHFPGKKYRVLYRTSVYSMPILDTSVKSLSDYLYKFISFRKLSDIILLGNSLGGHVGLLL